MKCSKVLMGMACGMAVLAMSAGTLAQEKKPTTAPATKPTTAPATKPADTTKPTTPAQPTGQPGKDAMPKMSPQEEACMKNGTPNENHMRFKEMVGTWTANCKCWMEGSEAPMEFTGVMVNTMIHDGRYLQHEFKGDFMAAPYTGTGTCGYNNATHKYEATWCDSMSTGMMFLTGMYDDATKTFTVTGDIDGPDKTGKNVKCKWRETIKIVSPDNHVMQMFCTYPGEKETKVMEINYTRGTGRGTTEIPVKVNPTK